MIQVAKLCDFGWAAVLDNQMKRTFCGTLDYVSPEMKDVGEYNESVDLWSVGVLAFELLAGFPPYRHEISNWRLCGSQRKMKWSWEVIYPPDITYQAQKFIEGLLRPNPL
jgi:serine/threonine protein kinase